MPANLVETARRTGREAWLATLPATISDVAERWSLDLGEPFQPGGQTAWVAPARTSTQGDLVLKVAWRHMEAESEADGLREWNGDGAVRLHAVDRFDTTVALLLERCRPGTTLATRPEPEQDVIIAGLLRRLWRVPQSAPRFRSLKVMCDMWADEFERKLPARGRDIDQGLAREGIELFRELPTTATDSLLLCTDLHAENVMAATREPWLVIDPKPFVGDPTYDALQHLLNCAGRLGEDPKGLVKRMAHLLDLESDRLLLWLFARCVQESPDWPSLLEIARSIRPSE